MGGNAFPNKCIRLKSNHFYSFEKECLEKLQSSFQNINVSSLKSYRQKDSFGDLDIMLSSEQKYIPHFDDVGKILNSIDLVRNGPVTSYLVPVNSNNQLFQVDIIYVPPQYYESALAYFAYNDLGNLLGRIFHRMGFKLGHKGLSYVCREENNVNYKLKEISITTNWKEALEFVGYDYKRWTEGFNTLEDIFKYAVSNHLANRIIFRLDETNHQARVRDKKRKTYQQFLLWINDPANNIKNYEDISKEDLRLVWLKKAFECFPEFEKEYNQIQEEAKIKRQCKAKFNGEIISQITGLQDKQLGKFMSAFSLSLPDKKSWIINNDYQSISAAIKTFYDNWRNND
jgi:hypothetical protein